MKPFSLTLTVLFSLLLTSVFAPPSYAQEDLLERIRRTNSIAFLSSCALSNAQGGDKWVSSFFIQHLADRLQTQVLADLKKGVSKPSHQKALNASEQLLELSKGIRQDIHPQSGRLALARSASFFVAHAKEDPAYSAVAKDLFALGELLFKPWEADNLKPSPYEGMLKIDRWKAGQLWRKGDPDFQKKLMEMMVSELDRLVNHLQGNRKYHQKMDKTIVKGLDDLQQIRDEMSAVIEKIKKHLKQKEY